MAQKNKGLNVKTLKRETLPEKIISEIKSLIDSGQLAPGSRLPSERDFAAMLGVSRPSLREALKALSVLGIVVNRQGEGNFLADNNQDWPTEPLSLFFSFSKGALHDIYEARKGVEKQTVELAAQRWTPGDIEAMETALANMRESLDDVDRFFEYDLKFHMAIASATRNTVIMDFMDKILRISFTTRDTLWKAADQVETHLKSDLEKHEVLLNLIKSRKSKEASDHTDRHLNKMLERIKKGVLRGEEKKSPDT